MPFTPLHLGPGLLLKAAMRRRFSLFTFAGAQFCIDLEPLVLILGNNSPLHRTLHTLTGGLFIGLCCGLATPWLTCRTRSLVPRLWPWSPVTYGVALFSGILGGILHVLMDAALYMEMDLLWPLVKGNPLLGVMDHSEMLWFCLLTGALGVLWIALTHVPSINTEQDEK